VPRTGGRILGGAGISKSGHDRAVHQDADGVWTILNDEDQQLALEQLDSEGRDWFADGPGGAEAGALSDVLAAAAGPNAKTGWIDAVVAAIGRQVARGHRRSPLLVIPGDGVWYHATASRNRRSIQQHGLDWSRMVPRASPAVTRPRPPECSCAATLRGLNGSLACVAIRPSTSGQPHCTMVGWKALPPAVGARTG
jgi:hypothetical protein